MDEIKTMPMMAVGLIEHLPSSETRISTVRTPAVRSPALVVTASPIRLVRVRTSRHGRVSGQARMELVVDLLMELRIVSFHADVRATESIARDAFTEVGRRA